MIVRQSSSVFPDGKKKIHYSLHGSKEEIKEAAHQLIDQDVKFMQHPNQGPSLSWISEEDWIRAKLIITK